MFNATKNQRMTKQRRIVLEELRKLKTHPSAEDLYEIIREKMPSISLGTVYRNLDVLWRNGQILKLDMSGMQSRYDGDIRPHYHVRCKCCGCIDDIPAQSVMGIYQPRILRTEYQIQGWKMEFEGICPLCQQTAPEEEEE